MLEPILRWAFVQNGYALVHAACVAAADQATPITARTDTGKTTTILRILQKQRRASDRGAFLSDDLTLLRSDGVVMASPKPLTISQHTLAATPTAQLSRRQRLAPLIQTRIHSRPGRRFALLLASTKLPVATINLYAQCLIPPPKHDIAQLIPQVRLRTHGRLAHLVVIERGTPPATEQLAPDDAQRILLRNSEDAYGFPPYPVVRHLLTRPGGHDLTIVEQAIVAAALRNVTAERLHGPTLDWWLPITQTAGLDGTDEVSRTPSLLPIASAESGRTQ